MRRLTSYIYSQRSLLDAEALASARSMDGPFPLDSSDVLGAANFNLQRPASIIGVMPAPVNDASVNVQIKPPTSPTPPSPHRTHSKSQSCETDLFEDNTMLKHFGRPKEPRRARTASQNSIMGASVVSVIGCRGLDAMIKPTDVAKWVF